MAERAGKDTLIAVTGSGGGVGAVVAAHLSQAGYRIRAVAIDPSQRRAFADETRGLPRHDAPEADFLRALEGAVAIVHAGGLSNENPATTRQQFFDANTVLTGRLAAASAKALPGPFIHLSSIRAIVGPLFDGSLTDDTVPAPACDYGASKLAAELALQEAWNEAGRSDCLILRLPPVYGPTLAGNLRTLLRLADTPWPLPLASLATRRSLVGSQAIAEAIAHLLRLTKKPQKPFLVSDAAPVTIADIVAAFRRGLDRPARLLPAPESLLSIAARVAGKADLWQRLSCEQICAGELLGKTGWKAPLDSRPGLELSAQLAADRDRRNGR